MMNTETMGTDKGFIDFFRFIDSSDFSIVLDERCVCDEEFTLSEDSNCIKEDQQMDKIRASLDMLKEKEDEGWDELDKVNLVYAVLHFLTDIATEHEGAVPRGTYQVFQKTLELLEALKYSSKFNKSDYNPQEDYLELLSVLNAITEFRGLVSVLY